MAINKNSRRNQKNIPNATPAVSAIFDSVSVSAEEVTSISRLAEGLAAANMSANNMITNKVGIHAKS
jgi:hypothetical protein